ncbi:MAG: nitrilase-related carbon-nitrogen hydrolase [Bacteroidia bacterium]|nr:carbon-nitrogen hydrolase family protein [Bacteroidia bacterium]MDW8015478.1 nitrilase-related carbon-nitrogen hydrolase [Bacteroidia bacterium]
MKRHVLLIGLLVGLGMIGLYAWLFRPLRCASPTFPPPPSIVQLGDPEGAEVALVGLQPELEPADYSCAERLMTKLSAYLDSARRSGCLPESSIVVFPEYIGSWLVLLGEPIPTYRAQTLQGALTWAALNHLLHFGREWVIARQEGWKNPAAVAAFRLKAPQMAQAFHRIFSTLAYQYRVFIVAGSIVLPGAEVRGDSVLVDSSAPLENVSFFYLPNGRPDAQVVRKAFPTVEELGFTQPAREEKLPVYETPFGRLGILICADSWFPQSYSALGKVDILAVPSYLMGDSCWNRPWKGYSGWEAPENIHSTDLTEGQAWLTYGVGGRLPQHDSTAIGLNVFLRGRFWDVGSDGKAIVVTRGSTETVDASIVCLRIKRGG